MELSVLKEAVGIWKIREANPHSGFKGRPVVPFRQSRRMFSSWDSGGRRVGASLSLFQGSCVLLLGHGCTSRSVAPLLSLPEQSLCFSEHLFVLSLQLYLL